MIDANTIFNKIKYCWCIEIIHRKDETNKAYLAFDDVGFISYFSSVFNKKLKYFSNMAYNM